MLAADCQQRLPGGINDRDDANLSIFGNAQNYGGSTCPADCDAGTHRASRWCARKGRHTCPAASTAGTSEW
jgi:hypothetical protein